MGNAKPRGGFGCHDWQLFKNEIDVGIGRGTARQIHLRLDDLALPDGKHLGVAEALPRVGQLVLRVVAPGAVRAREADFQFLLFELGDGLSCVFGVLPMTR